MTVKEELGNLLERLVTYYELTPEGLPSIPKRKDVDQSIYIDEPGDSSWSRWTPMKQTSNPAFLALIDALSMKFSDDVLEYFTSYYFFKFDIKYKTHSISLSEVAPSDNLRRVQMRFENFRDTQDGEIKMVPIGTKNKSGQAVVVELETGVVKTFDNETYKTRTIAASLQEFLKNSEPK